MDGWPREKAICTYIFPCLSELCGNKKNNNKYVWLSYGMNESTNVLWKTFNFVSIRSFILFGLGIDEKQIFLMLETAMGQDILYRLSEAIPARCYMRFIRKTKPNILRRPI